MPLRDHFHPPLSDRRSWAGFHGQWPAMIVIALNRRLPERYIAEPQVYLGSGIEIDAATFEEDEADFPASAGEDNGGGVATAVWAPTRPTLAVAIDLTDEYEVRVYDTRHGRRLVAAVEIVSPSNKDRPEHRRAFVAKCAAMLQDRVCVAIVDLVTNRASNLYGDLMELFGHTDPALAEGPPSIHASACRLSRPADSWLLETWAHPLVLGQPLPTLPLWLAENYAVPLELEPSYEETCRILRIAPEGGVMPIHDWTRVDAGLFHAFHQRWIGSLCDALNMGGLPPDYFALAEQSIRGPIPDVLTLQLKAGKTPPPNAGSQGITVAVAPPQVRMVQTSEVSIYARKADRVTVRHRHGEVVAVIEIVSPGNKASISELRAFVEKTSSLIQQGINVLVIDLFPPTKRDPRGIHAAIWDEIDNDEPTLPADKPLALASYDAGPVKTAYVEPVAVGDVLPDMPLFLKPEFYVPVPLEATYQTTWRVFPTALKTLFEPTQGAENA
jgi:hypothetical protein